MLTLLARSWWLIAIRGAAALAFGLLTLFNPALTVAVLVLFFGAYALVNGPSPSPKRSRAAGKSRTGPPTWSAAR